MFGWKNPTIHRKDTNYKKRQQYALHFVHGRTQRTYGCHVKISEVVFSRYLRLQMSVKYLFFFLTNLVTFGHWFIWVLQKIWLPASFHAHSTFHIYIHKHIAQFELKLIHPQNNCIVIFMYVCCGSVYRHSTQGYNHICWTVLLSLLSALFRPDLCTFVVGFAVADVIVVVFLFYLFFTFFFVKNKNVHGNEPKWTYGLVKCIYYLLQLLIRDLIQLRWV